MERPYTFPRVLRMRIAWLRAAICMTVPLSLVCLAVAFRSDWLVLRVCAAALTIILGASSRYALGVCRHWQDNLNDAILPHMAPAGVYFTGSLYWRSERTAMPGIRAGFFSDISRYTPPDPYTHLSRDPYPDGRALGSNGVLKERNGHAWLALLVSVNGSVRATRVAPAPYGWHSFIKYRC